MIHEITLSDRLKASLSARPRPPIQERMTCEREAAESQVEEIRREKACSVCGDPEDYCAPCEGCGKPVCDKHRSSDAGMCFGCELEALTEVLEVMEVVA